MKYSRPGGMPPSEQEKIRRRLGGHKNENASGATQEAPEILAGSEPSSELKGEGMELSPEVLAAAEHNRRNREAVRQLEAETDKVEAEAAAEAAVQAEDPVNGEEPLPASDAALLE
jgi:hypothetical protein